MTDLRAVIGERALAATRQGPLLLGISGPQGSGKSTLAAAMKDRLEAEGVGAAVLSLDDLYHGRRARARLAHCLHPLFAVRGVPGTHDAVLGWRLVAAWRRGEAVTLPRFDKGEDERAAQGQAVPAGTPVLILEGWCLGARPQPEAQLARPVNALEAAEDPEGRWRRTVNAALARRYAPLFAAPDLLVQLRAPDFATVRGWRWQQEQELRARLGGPAAGMADEAAFDRFMQCYERLTGWCAEDLPARADLVIDLAADRRVTAITERC